MPQTRQLAAIMFTDIVGYTALMGEDERKAHKILNTNRQLHKPIIEEFDGNWIKELGDGIMASFSTVSDAVYAAVKIQEACYKANEYKLRIGIHQGEVIMENNDVFGDAVNIAARIQAAASPGTIFVSESIHNIVSNKDDIQTSFVKNEILKNVSQPMKLYQVVTDTMVAITPAPSTKNSKGISGGDTSSRSKKRRTMLFGIAGLFILLALVYFVYFPKINQGTNPDLIEKSIAVLPFVNISNDPDQDFFSDGLSDEVRNRLSNIIKLRVIGRASCYKYKGINHDLREVGQNLGVSYLMEGSVRISGNELRITTQLINAEDGRVLSVKTFQRTLNDIFAIQDEISLAVLKDINIKLFGAEKDAVFKRYTDNVEAHDSYLKGQYYSNKNDWVKAIDYFKEAIAIDSNYAIAYAGMSYCYLSLGYFGLMPADESLPQGIDAAKKSLQLDDQIAESHLAIGRMKLHHELNIEEALIDFQKAISINPNSAECHVQLGFCATLLGNVEEALQHASTADSLDPLNLMNLNFVATIFSCAGETDKGMNYGRRIIETDSTSSVGYAWIGSGYRMLKQYDKAIAEFKTSVKLDSNAYNLSELGVLYGFTGDKLKAKDVINEIKKIENNGATVSYQIGIVYASIGDYDLAFQYFDKAMENHEGFMLWLKINLHDLPIANDPRALVLYKKLGLPTD
jgi:adenylate cyclase